MKKIVAALIAIVAVFSSFASLIGCDDINKNNSISDNSGVEDSSSSIETEIVTADFLSFDSLDNFTTGGWAQFGGLGANASLSIYEGWVGLGNARRTGRFLKFKLGTSEQTDVRAAFSTTANPSDIIAELEEKKGQGYTALSVDMYSMYENIWMMVFGSVTNFEAPIHGLVFPLQWSTFTYSIDNLIAWYSTGRMGLGEGEMPLVGFGNDNNRYAEVYISEFYYVK